MCTYLDNNNKYVVVYYSGSGFTDDITLLTINSFYAALDGGMFRHYNYVAIGCDTLEDAKNLYKEIYVDRHFGEEIEDKYIIAE